MKLSTKSRILKIFLDITSLGGIVYFIGVFWWYINYAIKDMLTGIVNIATLIVGFTALFWMIWNLRGILSSLLEDNPFTMKNVKRIKGVAKGSFFISFCYIVNIFINGKLKDMRILMIDDFGIHTDWDFMIFFMAGGFIYILGKVFEKAVEYKEDNDLTI